MDNTYEYVCRYNGNNITVAMITLLRKAYYKHVHLSFMVYSIHVLRYNAANIDTNSFFKIDHH
jgi:hypothetical protein